MVRKICKQKGCKRSPKCDHPWWFDVMVNGKRWRMRVIDFAIPRGATEPVTSKDAAKRVWEPRFIAEIMAGRDPRVPPQTTIAATEHTVRSFLDLYVTDYVEAEGLASAGTIKSNLKAVKRLLGDEPLAVLEDQSKVLAFKRVFRSGDEPFDDEHEVATVNRALSNLRSAINWGIAHDPPLLSKTPFGLRKVKINAKDETQRDRRVHPPEEQALLLACQQMSGPDHKRVGPAMHDRIIGAIETCCRRGELLRIRSRHIDWQEHTIAILGKHAKDGENRRIPFDPHGRLEPILKRRSKLGPNAFIFGSAVGEAMTTFRTAWESLLLVANGYKTKRTTPGARVDRALLDEIDLHWHDLRHEGACRLLVEGVDIRSIQLMLGHSTLQQTQRYLNITDEELRKAMTCVWARRHQLKAVAV